MLHMRWLDLMFMHWPVKPEVLRPMIPAALEIDTFDSEAWIGVVPFRMTGIRPRYVPSLPWVSAFVELNVRTYVKYKGRRGVWFMSLDAANPLAVRMARWQFHLPYFDAKMSCIKNDKEIQYCSKRTHQGAAAADYMARYRPVGDVYQSAAGSIEHWLTEQYVFYSADRNGDIYHGDVDHTPWPLQIAEAEVEQNTMTKWLGIDLPDTKPLLHFSNGVDVVGWLLRKSK